MRPENLYKLFRPVTALNGIGPRLGSLISRFTGPYLVHLLWHLPSGFTDRRFAPKVAEAKPGTIATITVQIDKHQKPPNKRLPYKVICSDETGRLSLVFFRAREDYLRKSLPEGETRVVSGLLDTFGKEIQMTHPDHIVPVDAIGSIMVIEPIYPLTTGLTMKVLNRTITEVLREAPDLPEWTEERLVKRENWPSWREAVIKAHSPEKVADLQPTAQSRRRLAYDELLSNQIALALTRRDIRRNKGRPLRGTGALVQRVLKTLSFKLTAGQLKAIQEIQNDLSSETRMLRLLQGDVGSGKTVVALMAMLTAAEAGSQAVLMAPTEILARQHFATINPLAKAAGLQVAFLTGGERGKNRSNTFKALESGSAHIAIGTHALFQKDVVYKNLALSIIDEQHRFGVHQRLALTSKGNMVDTLVMTATPIPRTLMLTAYGDIDTSRLIEKPAGRKPVDTRVISLERLSQVVESVGRALSTGNKVFWVCPLVKESEKLDLAAAQDRHAHLQHRFPDQVGLIHGRMKAPEKETVMEEFINGPLDILVATTVIEVGVDVPKATVMVIEHAERFGLAQLHQLRGRIGRSDSSSTCLLIYNAPLTEMAQTRLSVMRETNDGFVIAEKDLKLRGAGELLGTRQSGLPEFRIADLQIHADLLSTARDDALLILDKDPELTSKRGLAVRTLLYLFERDAVVGNLRSG